MMAKNQQVEQAISKIIETEVNNIKVEKYMSDLIDGQIAACHVKKERNSNLRIEHSI